MDQRQIAYPFDGLLIIPEVSEISEFGEDVPPTFRDSEIVVDQGWNFHQFLTQLPENDYNEELWWKFDKHKSKGGKVISFGLEGRKLFLGIAKILISFHENSKFSGNLLCNLRILGDLSVTHTPSVEENDEENAEEEIGEYAEENYEENAEDAEENDEENADEENAGENEKEKAFGGRENDIIHFRWMVAAVVRKCFPETYDSILSPFFRLFFSKIFIHPEGVKNYFVCQLYHPIFFNSADRCNLIRMIRDLYNQNPRIFRNRFNLSRYGFHKWWLRIDQDHDVQDKHDVWKLVLYHKSNFSNLYSFKNNCYALPLYIRNVHEHFSKKAEIFHEDIDSGLDIIFLGVSAAIIDAAIRDLHGYWDCFGCCLAHLQRSPPYGLSFAPYRYRQ